MGNYFMAKTVSGNMESVIEKTKEALSKEGFGIITEIDMKTTLKNKIDKDIPPYQILGACNPGYAYQAVQSEPQVGVMLPCNVIVREVGDSSYEVAAIDPLASMMAIENEHLSEFASEVKERLKSAVESI